MKLFRGEHANTWTKRFAALGWPEDLARHMAQFLTGEARTPPTWEAIRTHGAQFILSPLEEKYGPDVVAALRKANRCGS